MTVPAEVTGVLEVAVYADDLDAASGFYGGTLGLTEIGRVAGRHVFYRCGTTTLLVFRSAATLVPGDNPDFPVPTHGTVGPGHICFAVDGSALERTRETLMRQGVAIETDFRWPNGARSIYVRDPAGNSVEFAEPRLWSET